MLSFSLVPHLPAFQFSQSDVVGASSNSAAVDGLVHSVAEAVSLIPASLPSPHAPHEALAPVIPVVLSASHGLAADQLADQDGTLVSGSIHIAEQSLLVPQVPEGYIDKSSLRASNLADPSSQHHVPHSDVSLAAIGKLFDDKIGPMIESQNALALNLVAFERDCSFTFAAHKKRMDTFDQKLSSQPTNVNVDSHARGSMNRIEQQMAVRLLLQGGGTKFKCLRSSRS